MSSERVTYLRESPAARRRNRRQPSAGVPRRLRTGRAAAVDMPSRKTADGWIGDIEAGLSALAEMLGWLREELAEERAELERQRIPVPARQFYSPEALAYELGRSRTFVLTAIRDGRLRARRAGARSYVITPEDAGAFIDAETALITAGDDYEDGEGEAE